MTDSHDSQLPTHVDAITKAYETALRAGQSVSLEEELAKVPPAFQQEALETMLYVELEVRQQRGETLDSTAYYERLPDSEPMVQRVFARLQSETSSPSTMAPSLAAAPAGKPRDVVAPKRSSRVLHGIYITVIVLMLCWAGATGRLIAGSGSRHTQLQQTLSELRRQAQGLESQVNELQEEYDQIAALQSELPSADETGSQALVEMNYLSGLAASYVGSKQQQVDGQGSELINRIEQLMRETQGSSEELGAQVMGSLSIGRIREAQGQQQEAVDAYAKCVALQVMPSDAAPTYRLLQGFAEFFRGSLLLEMGNQNGGIECLRRCVKVVGQEVEALNQISSYKGAYATALAIHARAEGTVAGSDVAKQHFASAEEMLTQRVYPADSRDDDAKISLADFWHIKGQYFQSVEDWDAAVDAYRKSVEQREQVLDSRPADKPSLTMIVHSLLSLQTVYDSMGDAFQDKSLATTMLAVKYGERLLSEDDPDATLKWAGTKMLVATALSAQKKGDEALTHFREVETKLTSMLADGNDSAAIRDALATCQQRHGEHFISVNDKVEALAVWRRAEANYMALVKADPGNAEHKLGLAIVLFKQASTGADPSFHPQRLRAIDLLNDILKSAPQAIVASYLRAMVRFELATSQLGAEDLNGAGKVLTQALADFDTLLASEAMSSTDLEVTVSGTHFLSRIHALQGRAELAMEYRRRALRHSVEMLKRARRAAQATPTPANWVAEAEAANWVAYAHATLDELEQSQVACETALEQLASRSQPGDESLMRAATMLRSQLAQALAQAGKRGEAEDLLRQLRDGSDTSGKIDATTVRVHCLAAKAVMQDPSMPEAKQKSEVSRHAREVAAAMERLRGNAEAMDTEFSVWALKNDWHLDFFRSSPGFRKLLDSLQVVEKDASRPGDGTPAEQ